MEAFALFIVRWVFALILCGIAAFVFTATPLDWTYWEFFALAIGINVAATQLDS